MGKHFITLLLCLCASACLAQDQPVTRVRDLTRYVGQQVTVKGRTGQIMENLETPGVHVFNLRDDYGDQVFIRSTQPQYPIIGVTCFVTGKVSMRSGQRFLDATPDGIKQMYAPPQRVNVPLIIGITAVMVIAGIVLAARMVRREQQKAQLPPIWGSLTVEKGTENASQFLLRQDSTPIGRGVDPEEGIVCFVKDTTVSRQHGKIVREGDKVFFVDTSTHGSQVDNAPLSSGKRAPLKPGSVIEMGKNHAIVTFRPADASPSQTVAADDLEMAQIAEKLTKPA